MSCVVSVVGICESDDGLKISPSRNVQTPPNDKHYGYGDPCLILKFLLRFHTAALNKAAHCRQMPGALAQGEGRAEDLPDCGGVDLVGISGKLCRIFFQEGVRKEGQILLCDRDRFHKSVKTVVEGSQVFES